MTEPRAPDRSSRGESIPTRIWTDIPARLDRLPFSRFHLLVIAALGITWILDGLEVTIVGSIGPALESPRVLGFTPEEVGSAASGYVIGAVIGALVFGWLTDRYGRKHIFFVTLAVYLAGVLLTATAWSFSSFTLFRAITGLGIGGEYAAINSAIDELIPARYRGRVDLIVNGSFWIGAAAGSGASLFFLDPHIFAPNVGWRFGFVIGGVLGLGILLLRRRLPESPRWLVTHGRAARANATIDEIERRVQMSGGTRLKPVAQTLELHPRAHFGFSPIIRQMIGPYRRRSVLALILMTSQAFLFNAIFFSYGLVMTKFHGVAAEATGPYLFAISLSNFLGPVILAHLFDTIGRRKMVAATYALSGLLLVATAIGFVEGAFTAWSQTFAWMCVFFFASAAASSAYLTASEIFPLEARASAIAVFYAAGTALGGSLAPAFFGYLIGLGSAVALGTGYFFAALLMLLAAFAEWMLGVDAEMQPLETLAPPLSFL